jgi:L-lactate dehydrogenase complex protein LldG
MENRTGSKEAGDKEQVLSRIRAALGRPGRAVAPESLPPFACRNEEGRPDGLVEQFVRETERVGVRVSRARTAEELRGLLRAFYPPEESEPVAVSDNALLRRLGVREWLASDKRRLVPAPEEFAPGGYAHALVEAGLGVTGADYALADTGTLALVSGGELHRLISLVPPVHVCVLDPRRILPSLADLLAACGPQGPPPAMTLITGPSRTADIELTITVGIHGPRSLHVVLYQPAE